MLQTPQTQQPHQTPLVDQGNRAKRRNKAHNTSRERRVPGTAERRRPAQHRRFGPGSGAHRTPPCAPQRADCPHDPRRLAGDAARARSAREVRARAPGMGGPLQEGVHSDKWEIRLQIVRALPLFRWTAPQRRRVEAILLENIAFPQTFVRAWALDSLTTVAEHNTKLMPIVLQTIEAFEQSPKK